MNHLFGIGNMKWGIFGAGFSWGCDLVEAIKEAVSCFGALGGEVWETKVLANLWLKLISFVLKFIPG